MSEKKNNKTKRVTLEDLALMIANGFAESDAKFADVNKKIVGLTDAINENFKEVNRQINKINLNAVDVVRQEEFEKLENRVVTLEEKMA